VGSRRLSWTSEREISMANDTKIYGGALRDNSLTGKTFVSTGGGTGLGRAMGT